MSSHAPCRFCRRLLVPVGGKFPPHRVPAKINAGRTSVPLTASDAPWCQGGSW